MRITHYICPRDCGKTEKAKEIQMEDLSGTLLFIYRNGRFGASMRKEPKFRTIIYDEFLLTYSHQDTLSQKESFLRWILCDVMQALKPDGHLILFSTPDKLRNSSSFLLMQKGLINRSQIESDYVNNDTIMEEIIEFQKLFLCPFGTNVTLVKTDFGVEKNEKELKQFKQMYGNELFETEMKGNFLR